MVVVTGIGGGGNGGAVIGITSYPGFPGTPNTGGGAGGGSTDGGGTNGGNGGSGIVKVRYTGSLGQVAAGGETELSGGFYYHTFTSSADLTFSII